MRLVSPGDQKKNIHGTRALDHGFHLSGVLRMSGRLSARADDRKVGGHQ